jgi:hypothetical protein
MAAVVEGQPDAPEILLTDDVVSGPAPLDASVLVSASDVDGSSVGEMAITADYGDGTPPEPVTVLIGTEDGVAALAMHRYLEPGTYTVEVTIEDPDGLTDAATSTVTVEPGPPQLRVDDVHVSEEGALAQLPVRLTEPAATPVDVSFTSLEGTASRADFDVTNGVLRFDPGVTEVVVPVAVADDRTAEADEAFDVQFTVTDGDAVAVDPTAVVTILDDEAPVPPVDRPPTLTAAFDVYDYEVPMAAGQSSVELPLADAVTASDETGPLPVTCNRALDPGVFTVGTTTVRCSATDATGRSRSKTFRVVLSATDEEFGDFDPGFPTIRIGDVSAIEEAGTVTVPITLDPPSPQMQFVQVDVGSSNDVVRTRVVRTLLPGETADAFTLTLRDDSVAELDVLPLFGNGFGVNVVPGSLTITDGDADTRAPQLSAPAERFLALLPASVLRPVALDVGSVSAFDEADGPLPVTCTPPPGSLFANGTTKVTCSATDSAGRTGRVRLPVVVRLI